MLAIIDFTNDDDALTAEQQELDDHDDCVSKLMIRTLRLISTLSPTATDGLCRTLTRCLERLREKLAEAVNAIPEDRSDGDSACTLEQYAEQIADIKVEMKDICTCILNIELTGDDPITGTQNAIEQMIFRCSVAIRKRLRASTDTVTREAVTTTPKTPGAKLPK